MPEAQELRYSRRLVRFWVLYWPMLVAGVLAAAVVSAILITAGLIASGDRAALTVWPFLLWMGGSVGARTALLPALLAAAMLAGRYSGNDAVPTGFATATGAVLGCLSGLYHDGLVENALIGAFAGVAGCLAMWGVGYLIVRLWPART